VSYILSARAETEFEDIFQESLARWGEAQARRYAERIHARFELLAQFPNLGRARPELGASIRSIPVGAHVVFFKAEGPLILHIRHAKRADPRGEDFDLAE
jgi:toxin ParE1/3/4